MSYPLGKKNSEKPYRGHPPPLYVRELSFMLRFALFFSYFVASLQEQTPFQDFPPLAEKSDCSCSLSEALLEGFFHW